MEHLLAYLRELNMASILLRIFLAVLVGGVLGMERGRKRHPAGLRTYILVCLGAALVMMTNQFVYNEFGASDPVRLGAQVISGIGFLGAGTIMVTGRSRIKGLTTAAGLWASACGGLAIGIGFYEGALLGGAVIVFTMAGLQRFDNWMKKHSRYIDLYVECSTKGSFGEFLQYARENGIEISDIQASQEETFHKEKGKQRTASYIFTATSEKKVTHADMIEILSNARGIQYLEEL